MRIFGKSLETLVVLLAGGIGFFMGIWKFTASAALLTATQVLDVWAE